MKPKTFTDASGQVQPDRRAPVRRERVNIKAGLLEIDLSVPEKGEDLIFDRTLTLMDQTRKRERAAEIQSYVTAGFAVIAGCIMAIGAYKGLQHDTYSKP